MMGYPKKGEIYLVNFDPTIAIICNKSIIYYPGTKFY